LGFIETFQPKKYRKLAFSVGFFRKNRTQGKKHPLQKMIGSTGSIYGKIFRLLAFVMEKLDKVQSGWEVSHCSPHLDPFTRFQFFEG
jgi:hypothetical protein